MFTRLIRSDEGLGMITAVAVAFVLFALSAVWFSVSIHSVESTASDRYRTQAVFVAESASREAMAELVATGGAFAGHGETGGICNIQSLTSQGEVLGSYWTQVSPMGDPAERRYLIESWAWTPDLSKDAQQTRPKKVALEAKIVSGDFFSYGVFAGSGNKPKETAKGKFKPEKIDKLMVWGDGYFGESAKLKDVKYFDNGSHPGDGNLYVDGYLRVEKKKTFYVEGDTVVRYKIYDENDKKGWHVYNGDVTILEDTGDTSGKDKFDKLDGHEIWMENSDVEGTIYLPAGATIQPPSKVNDEVPPTNVEYYTETLAELPDYEMPDFDPAAMTWDHYFASEGDFKTWWNANKSLGVEGVIYIDEPGKKVDIDFKDSVISGDLTIVGNLKEMKVKEAGRAMITGGSQVSIIHVPQDADDLEKGKIKIEKHSQTNESMRWFFYTDTTLEIKDRATVYGAIYAAAIKSGGGPNKLYYRQLDVPIDAAGGEIFDFSNPEDVWTIQPRVWREHTPDIAVNFEGATPAAGCNLP